MEDTELVREVEGEGDKGEERAEDVAGLTWWGKVMVWRC